MRTVGLRRVFAVSAVAAGIALTGCENSVEAPAGTAAGDVAQEETAAAETPVAEPETTGGEGAATETADGGTGGAAADGMLSDEVMNRLETQFPALAAVVPQEQMRDLVNSVCGTVRSGDMGAAQQELQNRFNVDAAMAQQVVSFLERDVCNG